MTVPTAVEMIRAPSPPSWRSDFAYQIWQRRESLALKLVANRGQLRRDK